MDRNNNIYIFIYSSVLVILVAIILTIANISLKPAQEKNIRIEKMSNVLAAIGIKSDATDAEKLFAKYITEEIVINSKGEVLGKFVAGKQVEGSGRAFDINIKVELKNQADSKSGKFPLFIGEKDGSKVYIVPVYGKGLWAAIWGNIAFKDDLNTVYGANFSHESETPGLGAEISQPKTEGKIVFSDQFVGKTIFDATGNFVSVSTVKGGVVNQTKIAAEHGVDAISGGTLTSNGVTNMLYDCLINYVEYIKKNK